MATIDEKIIYHLDAILLSNSVAPIVPMLPYDFSEYIYLFERIKTEKITYQYAKKTITYSISDIVVTPSEIVVLINKHDKNAPNKCYWDEVDELYYTHEKSDYEADNFSVHLIIKKSPVNANKHLTLLEYQPGMSLAKISFAINQMLKKAIRSEKSKIRYREEHPTTTDSSGNKAKTTYKFAQLEFHGHLDSAFSDAISEGKIDKLDLIADDSYVARLDEISLFKETKTMVTMKVRYTGQDLTQSLQLLSDKNRKKFNRVKVHYKNHDKIPFQPTLDLVSLKPMDDFKVMKKSVLKNFTIKLNEGYEKLLSEIWNRMLPLF